MKYLYMVYMDEKAIDALPADELTKLHEEAGAYMTEQQRNGVVVGGTGLAPVKEAATVRVRDGQLSVTDGPFAETNEQLGGFCVVDARDLNEAIQVASKDPAARYGSLEVRRVVGEIGPDGPVSFDEAGMPGEAGEAAGE